MNYTWRRAFVLAMICFLCVAGFAGASTRGGSGAPASDGGTARLIVYRIPTMGRYVIVRLYVDNVVVGAIGYGDTYQGSLKPGRHVLSALATPRPISHERPPTILDARSGQTYTFTVKGNGEGSLFLNPMR